MERTQEQDGGEECCEVLSSGHDGAVSLMSALQLWSSAQDQDSSLGQYSSRQQAILTALSGLQRQGGIRSRKGVLGLLGGMKGGVGGMIKIHCFYVGYCQRIHQEFAI